MRWRGGGEEVGVGRGEGDQAVANKQSAGEVANISKIVAFK